MPIKKVIADQRVPVKIWTDDGLGGESVIYDNGSQQAIGGGSIVVHK